MPASVTGDKCTLGLSGTNLDYDMKVLPDPKAVHRVIVEPNVLSINANPAAIRVRCRHRVGELW